MPPRAFDAPLSFRHQKRKTARSEAAVAQHFIPTLYCLQYKRTTRVDWLGRHLLLDSFAEAADGGAHGDGGGGVEGVSPARLGLVAAAALPDADRLALHRVLSAEIAEKLGVLRHLLLLHHLAEGRAITGAVLADDT